MQRFRKNVWYQIGGDMNPQDYGATIARWTGYDVEIRQIQPTREYVGDAEAAEVGYPYWSREATYTDDDMREILSTRDSKGWAPQDYSGLDYPADARLTIALRFELAEAALSYGHHAEEGPAGWAADVIPSGRVVWWCTNAREWRASDAGFRRFLRESSAA